MGRLELRGQIWGWVASRCTVNFTTSVSGTEVYVKSSPAVTYVAAPRRYCEPRPVAAGASAKEILGEFLWPASRLRGIGVDPACASRPVTVISYQR